MANVFDVAKYILKKLGKMSTWKLHKLCYYSQAWSLAWDEKVLFPEDFEAWSNGPVCPVLFRAHKGMFMIDSNQFEFGDSTVFLPDEKENLDIICRDYGDKDPYWLKEQTHGEDPWKLARGNLPVGEPSNAINSKDSIGLYYGGL